MEILERKDAINRHQDEKMIIVETAFIASLALTEQYWIGMYLAR